jgi:PST family polysaccharide transporter
MSDEDLVRQAGAASGLANRAARGAFVTFGGQAFKIVLQVASVIVLARLLAPHDYGLIAMVMAVVGVADIFRDFGLSSAAIQAKELTEAQRDNLFWLNSLIGVALCTAIVAGAPLLSAFYGRPELTPLARVLALTFVLSGLATQYRADLNRRLRFGSLAVADVSASLVGLSVAVLFALSGAGYWSLAAQQIVQQLVMLAIVATSARWLPGAPRRHTPMAHLLRYGWHLVGTQLIGYVGNNTDSVIIGARFGAGQLGLYNRAFQLLMTPLSQLRSPTTTVALPVLSRLQHDPRRFPAYVVRGQLTLGYSLVAGLGLVAGAAAPAVDFFLGPQWTHVTPLLRLLAVAGALQTLSYVGYWVYLACDLTVDLRRYTLLSTAIRIVCIVVGSLWGVVGVAAGYAVAPAIAWPLSIWWLSRRAPIPTRELITGALRLLVFTTVLSLAAFGTSLATSSWPSILQLLACTAAAAAAYGLMTVTSPTIRRDVLDVLDVVRRATARSGAQRLPDA